MKKTILCLLMLASLVFPMSCTYEANPNKDTNLLIRCGSLIPNGKCYVSTFNTATDHFIDLQPKNAFIYDGDGFLKADSSGVVILTVPVGGKYDAKNNYTWVAKCFNSTDSDTANSTFVVGIQRPANWIGEQMEWFNTDTNGQLIIGGIILLVFIAVFAGIILKRALLL